MIAFEVDSKETVKNRLEGVSIIQYAGSLGGESLIIYPMLQTHGDIPVEERETEGINRMFAVTVSWH